MQGVTQHGLVPSPILRLDFCALLLCMCRVQLLGTVRPGLGAGGKGQALAPYSGQSPTTEMGDSAPETHFRRKSSCTPQVTMCVSLQNRHRSVFPFMSAAETSGKPLM